MERMVLLPSALLEVVLEVVLWTLVAVTLPVDLIENVD